jgi:hypothetical protein
LTEYYDDSGIKRSPNASARALKQYAEMQKDVGAVPIKLFFAKENPPHTPEDDGDDEEETSQQAPAVEDLKDGPA